MTEQNSSVGAMVDVRDYVVLRRSDCKDAGKKDKIKGIVQYSVQEALKVVNTESVTPETFKNEQLRKVIMQIIEAQLRFAGYIQTIAVFGNKFSYEAKSSRHTLHLFEVGKAPAPIFHIMVYDLAYINVPNVNISSNAEFLEKLRTLKQGLPKGKADEKLCPNKVVQTVQEVVCDADNLKMREATLQALDDVIEYCVAS